MRQRITLEIDYDWNGGDPTREGYQHPALWDWDALCDTPKLGSVRVVEASDPIQSARKARAGRGIEG